MWTKAFWKGVAERALWSFAGAIVAIMGADGFNLLKADLKAILLTALGAAVFSFFKSLAVNASGAGPVGSASMVFDRPEDPQNSST